MRQLIIGPPGTGKTTALLDIFRSNHGKKTILYLAFTRKAATEARERLSTLLDIDESRLDNVRTIHSLCFRDIGLRSDRIMRRSSYDELSREIGIDLGEVNVNEDCGMATGSILIFLENMARATGKSLEEVWSPKSDKVSIHELRDFQWRFKKFKEVRGLMDYTDLLHEYLAMSPVSPQVLIVDEGQDLSSLQWDVVEHIGRRSEEIYVAGDDDQAIYTWAGADVKRFQKFSDKVMILRQSYRLPHTVHQQAMRVRDMIHDSISKGFQPTPRKGSVNLCQSIDDLDLSSGEWYLLCRHGYQLRKYEQLCMRWGVPFESRGYSPMKSDSVRAILDWNRLMSGEKLLGDDIVRVYSKTTHVSHGFKTGRKFIDGERMGLDDLIQDFGLQRTGVWQNVLNKISDEELNYISGMLRRGESLTRVPRIRINTIHTVKGGEADNVAIMQDISSATYEAMQENPDPESRVFYVGVTRARDNLHIIEPESRYSFDL